MPIPKEILSVPRPKNTVVIVYGKDKNLYAVRQREGCKRIDGRNLPINGPTIGHIVDGVYVPIDTDTPSKVSTPPIVLKDWANITLCDRLFGDIKQELHAIYSHADTMKLYCISILKVCDPDINNYELKEAYENSFLSELYPDVALSKSTVSRFIQDLGKTFKRIIKFMQNRTAAVSKDHHILVDSTLKSDESKVNSLLDFSRKSRPKKTRDISVLYAFDLEAMEPVCSKCFPGNMLDFFDYKEFITENKIDKGFIVADKVFPELTVREYFSANKDLHYLNSIKRNSKLIERHHMLDFNAILPGYDGIIFRKEKCSGVNKWLYSFREIYRASQEEQDWLCQAKENETYSFAEYKEKQRTFGTIIFECDLDLPAETVYKAYEKRSEIEIAMQFYNYVRDFDKTQMQDLYSVTGNEFCDFLSTLLTFRLIKAFDKATLLEKYSYKKIMSVLWRAKKARANGDDWQLLIMNPSHEKILQALELIPKPEESSKRKPGRPKGSKNKNKI